MVDELQSAAEEVDQLNRTFDALLRIAQIEAGARRASFRAVDLSEVLAMLDEIYREVARDSIVLGDRELLTQMFANLIENSIRHCPQEARIACGVTLHHDAVWASVVDNGRGIPEAEHGRVLRRLYRLEKSRTSAGTGLGLSLVKAVADLHGAELRLDAVHPGLMVTAIFRRGVATPGRTERPGRPPCVLFRCVCKDPSSRTEASLLLASLSARPPARWRAVHSP